VEVFHDLFQGKGGAQSGDSSHLRAKSKNKSRCKSCYWSQPAWQPKRVLIAVLLLQKHFQGPDD